MKKKLISVLLAALLVWSLLPGLSAFAAIEPAASTNRLDDAKTFSYNRCGFPIRSYLYDTGSGLCRVEYLKDYQKGTQRIIVETYTYDGQIRSQRELPMELDEFGGLLIGKQHNYLVVGQRNPDESDDAEVIRVIKYSRSWKRLGSASLFGENTSAPFYFGGLRMAEDDHMLYAHTCHGMYSGHQANLTFGVNKDQMKVTNVRGAVLDETYGYVSHSSDQFVALDGEGRVVTVDLGDGCPREVTLYRHQKADGEGLFLPYGPRGRAPERMGDRATLLEIPGKKGSNLTGVGLSGFRITDSGFLVVGFSANLEDPDADLGKDQRNVFVLSMDQNDFSGNGARTIWLTDYPWDADKSTSITRPQFAELSDGRSIVLWGLGDTVYYQYIDQQGDPIGKTRSGKGALSDCVPVEIGDTVQWYVTEKSDPVFYKIDANGKLTSKDSASPKPTPTPTPTPPGSKSPFSDVKSGAYYYEPVLWAVKHNPQITNGTSATTFSPDATCTRGQVVTFLWRANGCPEPKNTKSPFKDVSKDAYYYKAVLWAVENGITNGTSGTTFSPNAPCTRAHVVTFLWRSEGSVKTGGQNPFRDVKSGQYYTDAVLWAVSKDITKGTDATHFSPDKPCSRGQIVTFLYRDMK